MNSELKYLLKGKWEFNIKDNHFLCKNKAGLAYVFENKDDLFFQSLLSTINSKGRANPDLDINYNKPETTIPLDLFHRVLRANEILFEQSVSLKETPTGLFCYSDYITDFRINYNEYSKGFEVKIDPQRMCKITRRIRDRARVVAKLSLEKDRIIMECTFPWTIMTIIMPTISD